MQVVLGDFAGVISDVQSIVTELNSEYRKIIRITGVSPDEYRDYQIEKRLPELEGELKVIRDELDEVLNTLDTLGVAGSEETVIITMRDQLNEILRDTEKITKMVNGIQNECQRTWNVDHERTAAHYS